MKWREFESSTLKKEIHINEYLDMVAWIQIKNV